MKLRITIIAAVLCFGSAARAQTIGPNPQTFADVQATIAYMWQQMLDLQVASSNEQAQLTTIENNPALQLGQFVTVTTQPEKVLPNLNFSFKVVTIPNTPPKLYILPNPIIR